MLLKIDPQTLLKIGSTNVTQNRFTNVTQNWFHKRYSKQIHKRYSKLVPQTLLKIGSTNDTKLEKKLVTFLSIKILKNCVIKTLKQNRDKKNAGKFKQSFIIYLNSLALSIQISLTVFKCF